MKEAGKEPWEAGCGGKGHRERLEWRPGSNSYYQVVAQVNVEPLPLPCLPQLPWWRTHTLGWSQYLSLTSASKSLRRVFLNSLNVSRQRFMLTWISKKYLHQHSVSPGPYTPSILRIFSTVPHVFIILTWSVIAVVIPMRLSQLPQKSPKNSYTWRWHK